MHMPLWLSLSTMSLTTACVVLVQCKEGGRHCPWRVSHPRCLRSRVARARAHHSGHVGAHHCLHPNLIAWTLLCTIRLPNPICRHFHPRGWRDTMETCGQRVRCCSNRHPPSVALKSLHQRMPLTRYRMAHTLTQMGPCHSTFCVTTTRKSLPHRTALLTVCDCGLSQAKHSLGEHQRHCATVRHPSRSLTGHRLHLGLSLNSARFVLMETGKERFRAWMKFALKWPSGGRTCAHRQRARVVRRGKI